MKPDLDQAIVAFNDWRATRTTRGHTPVHLQTLATSLVGHYPITQICEKLKINTTALKTWAKPATQSAEFITLPNSSSPPTSSASALTLTLSTGTGIDVHLSGELKPDFIVSLINSVMTEVR